MRRPDIQGLRTVAILAVLLYHIWPSSFPNGFLGVDVFFVISGHLMTRCLSDLRVDLRPAKIRERLLHFYSRRVQRIVPVYLAMICGTMSIARTLMLDSDFEKTRSDMFWSLGFASNLQSAFEKTDYFSEVFAYRPFLHCWSLGVEMQFYLLVPFPVFALLSIRGKQTRLWRFALSSALLVLSVIGQQLLANSNAQLSFGLVFCRIWQFFAGIIVHFLNVDEEQEERQQRDRQRMIWPFVLGQGGELKVDSQRHQVLSGLSTTPCLHASLRQSSSPSSSAHPSTIIRSTHPCEQEGFFSRLPPLGQFILRHSLSHLVLLALLTALFAPCSLPAVAVPIQATFVVLLAAAQLHLHHHSEQWPPSPLLSSVAAVQLGDLSYVWYLVHWPVIIFVKYFFTVDHFSPKYGLFTLLLTFVLALLVDRLLDAQVRRLPHFCSVLFLIALLYTFCFFFVLPTYYSGQFERMSTNKDHDNSLGEKMVQLDKNFGKVIFDELINPESRRRLLGTLSMYEKIKLNELSQAITFGDRYELLREEQWTGHLRREFGPDMQGRHFMNMVVERRVRGSGNWTVLLVGNSHAEVLARELQDEWRQHFRAFQMFTIPGCMPFQVPVQPDLSEQYPCHAYAQIVKAEVERTRPDILFMAFRWYDELLQQPLEEGPIEEDKLLRAFNQQMAALQPHVQRTIFFPAPHLLFKHDISKELAKRLWHKTPLDDLHLSLEEHRSLNRASYERVRHLNCPKCTVYDLADHFCEPKSDKCWAFDEQSQLAYFFDTNHLSYYGRQFARQFLRALFPKSKD